MQLLINDTHYDVSQPILLSDVPGLLNIQPDNLALAVNQTIITRQQWPDTELHHGDRVDAFSLVAGG